MNAQLSPKTTYDPNTLIDSLKSMLRLKNDAALSRALDVSAPVLSKIRSFQMPISGAVLIRMHEVSSLSITDLRWMMGDRRVKYRLSSSKGKPRVEAWAAYHRTQPALPPA